MTTKNPSTPSPPLDQKVKLAAQFFTSSFNLYAEVTKKQHQRRSDLRYFVRVLMFQRLRSEAFHRRRPAQRKKEVARLERLYFLLQG